MYTLLRGHGFKGYCLSESPRTTDQVKVMHYYRSLFNELARKA